ncbi:MAG: hypothetical protein ABFD08_02665 [Syntrophomonas sp.]
MAKKGNGTGKKDIGSIQSKSESIDRYNFIVNYVWPIRVMYDNFDTNKLKILLENSIVTVTDENLDLKDNFKRRIEEYSKKKDVYNVLNKLQINIRDLEVEQIEKTQKYIKVKKDIQEKYLGKEYFNIGLKPFLIRYNDALFFGVAILTYFGYNNFSLELEIKPNFKLSFEEITQLCKERFRGCTIDILGTSISLKGNINKLGELYRDQILLSLNLPAGQHVKIVNSEIYPILTCIDYSPFDSNYSVHNDYFYFLNQPLDRSTPLIFNSDYVRDIISKCQISHHDNYKQYIAQHRAILSLSMFLEECKENLKDIDFDKFIYSSIEQTIMPLQRVLSSYCILVGLSEFIKRTDTYFTVKELEKLRLLFKIGLRNYIFDEDYSYETVNEMMRKMRTAIGYYELEARIQTYIDTVDQILTEKNRKKKEFEKNLFTGLIASLPIILGLDAIDKSVAMLGKVGLIFAKNHPLQLTFGIWITIVLVIMYFYLKLLRTDKIKVYLHENENDSIMDKKNILGPWFKKVKGVIFTYIKRIMVKHHSKNSKNETM